MVINTFASLAKDKKNESTKSHEAAVSITHTVLDKNLSELHFKNIRVIEWDKSFQNCEKSLLLER